MALNSEEGGVDGGLAMFAVLHFEWWDLDLAMSKPAWRHTVVVGSSDSGGDKEDGGGAPPSSSETVLGVSSGLIGRDGLHSPLCSNDDDFCVDVNCNRHFVAVTWSDPVIVGCGGGYYWGAEGCCGGCSSNVVMNLIFTQLRFVLVGCLAQVLVC